MRESEVDMSPIKQAALGLAGCILVPGSSFYRLQNGTQTHNVAVTVSLLLAEPSLRRLLRAEPMSCGEATAQGYRIVRTYEEAMAQRVV